MIKMAVSSRLKMSQFWLDNFNAHYYDHVNMYKSLKLQLRVSVRLVKRHGMLILLMRETRGVSTALVTNAPGIGHILMMTERDNTQCISQTFVRLRDS